MIEYGLAFLGWEVSLKYEVFKRDCRRESLRFSVALQKKLDVTHAMNATLLSFFPEAIQQIIMKTTEVDDILDILDNGFDSPVVMW
eukprot:CAMPEP_0114580812 /NCGR_PEP_ID=MMETSP0125-20121206/5011_1 /TAXON_ID=485358 ORGANISM="Aristerostoma sp., Strain ATCC 50986" /NCGR_SAMPLE_ID=MMETSP0125 /ASSEMBLY_ACC=CAM_ASM_000245 /LENGTH=85 /DNA_ID=CAMNT_0001772575 /DNA_START=3397 /DNA_END=3651 /DNA_ORIENTATION=-